MKHRLALSMFDEYVYFSNNLKEILGEVFSLIKHDDINVRWSGISLLVFISKVSLDTLTSSNGIRDDIINVLGEDGFVNQMARTQEERFGLEELRFDLIAEKEGTKPISKQAGGYA